MNALAAPRPPRRRWLIAVCALALLVGPSLLARTELGAGAPPRAAGGLTMGGIARLSQSFAIDRPGLAGVRIWLRDAASPAPALPLTMRLTYRDGPPIELAAATMTAAAAGADGALDFRFSPLSPARSPYVPTDTLQFSLEIPELPPASGPQVMTSGGYAAGSARIDDRPAADLDIAFAPIYQSTWLDPIWPVSRMAAGKPGPLGWPAAYPLLAGGFLLLLIGALGRLAAMAGVQPGAPGDQ